MVEGDFDSVSLQIFSSILAVISAFRTELVYKVTAALCSHQQYASPSQVSVGCWESWEFVN